MRQLNRQNDIKKDKWFAEFNKHLMNDDMPSVYFNALAEENLFPSEHPFCLLIDLKKVEQSPIHHPEGNVWNHTMHVIDNAADRKHLSKEPEIFMWAALLHDLGKAVTTKRRNGKITAYGHDKKGQAIARDFLRQCGRPESFVEKASLLVRWHMQALFVLNHLPFANLEKMTAQADVNEVALLALCDRLGRGDTSQKTVLAEKKNILRFIEKCKEYIIKKGKHKFSFFA